jgi:transcriptional regulator with XRE-family HTH domain
MSSPGARVREARELRGLNQKQLAQACGIKQSSISEIETGETKVMGGDTLLAISAALKVRPAWIYYNKGPRESSKADSLTPEESKILATYNALTPKRKHIFHTVLNTLMGEASKPKRNSTDG